MPTLYCWSLYLTSDGAILADGTASGHPKLPDGLSVNTSPVEKAWVEDGVLMLLTRSGNRYSLPPEAISPRQQGKTAVCLERLGLSAGLVEQWENARQEADKARLERIESGSKAGELYLEVAGCATLAAFFRSAQGTLVEIRPYIHVGMFQDSIMLTDWSGGTVDFRYFPKGDKIEPYHFSDGLTAIRLHNRGVNPVTFGVQGKETLCPPGAVTLLSVAEHDTEGLFSPDAVNGKGLYASLLGTDTPEN